MTNKETTIVKETLNEGLNRIQKELKAPKGQFNSFGNFKYRSCEDILEAVKPLLKDLILTLNDEVVLIGDRYYIRAIASLTDGNSTISISAFAREPQEKTKMDVAQVTGTSSTYARKYALNGLFLIDDTKDPDSMDNSKNDKKVIKTPAQKFDEELDKDLKVIKNEDDF